MKHNELYRQVVAMRNQLGRKPTAIYVSNEDFDELVRDLQYPWTPLKDLLIDPPAEAPRHGQYFGIDIWGTKWVERGKVVLAGSGSYT